MSSTNMQIVNGQNIGDIDIMEISLNDVRCQVFIIPIGFVVAILSICPGRP